MHYINIKSFIGAKLTSTHILNIDNIQNFFLSTNQHIGMISEGSRDTEDKSYGCWKFSFASQK